jgi:hypothetical protein
MLRADAPHLQSWESEISMPFRPAPPLLYNLDASPEGARELSCEFARYDRKAVRSGGLQKTVDRVEPGSQGRQQNENTFYTRREMSPAGVHPVLPGAVIGPFRNCYASYPEA